MWQSHGPFTRADLLFDTRKRKSFLEIVSLAERDEVLKARDPELIKWTRTAREIWRMMPASFMTQLLTLVVFGYFVYAISAFVMGRLFS